MKPFTLIVTTAFLFITSLQAQIVNIPDPAFLVALIEEGVDANRDSLISYSEAEAVFGLYVPGKGIINMAGIEAFINLIQFPYNACSSYGRSESRRFPQTSPTC